MQYLIGIILALLGLVGYLFTKKNSAEALLQNNNLDKKLNVQDQQITQDNALNAVEEQKRKEIQDQLQKNKENSNATNLDELNNFFNTPKQP